MKVFSKIAIITSIIVIGILEILSIIIACALGQILVKILLYYYFCQIIILTVESS